ncbi:MAG: hypothetical protein EAY76_07510, partial [Alphaproteobacteria bacterium]
MTLRIMPLVMAGTFVWVCAFAYAFGSDTHQWNADTFVQITPSDRPGVEAEVTFQNRDIHPLQVERFTVELDGLAVGLVLELNTDGADDLLTVTPPPGYYADP